MLPTMHNCNTLQVDIFSFAMLLFELLTGQRPFESLTTTQELNRAVAQGERPVVAEGNLEPAFPAMIDLMYDCWKHGSSERPNADEVGGATVTSPLTLHLSLPPHPLRSCSESASPASSAESTPSQSPRIIPCRRSTQSMPVRYLQMM